MELMLRNMKRAMAVTAALLVVSSALFIVPSCSASNRAAAREVVRVVDTACVVIPVMVEHDIVEEVCATERDLAPIVEAILRHRREKLAAPASSGSASLVCVPEPPPEAFPLVVRDGGT